MTRTATRRPRYRVNYHMLYRICGENRDDDKYLGFIQTKYLARRICRLLNASPRATRKQK